MKKSFPFTAILFIALAVLVCSPATWGQKQKVAGDVRKTAISEMREFKHNFLKRELGLSREQEQPFFKAYDQMTDELIRIGEETRTLERKTISDANATDTEIESATRTIFEQKKKEGEIELKYLEEFKNILNKRQLLKLKDAERRFNRGLMHHSSPKAKEDKNTTT